jgi:hypothetical protein
LESLSLKAKIYNFNDVHLLTTFKMKTKFLKLLAGSFICLAFASVSSNATSDKKSAAAFSVRHVQHKFEAENSLAEEWQPKIRDVLWSYPVFDYLKTGSADAFNTWARSLSLQQLLDDPEKLAQLIEKSDAEVIKYLSSHYNGSDQSELSANLYLGKKYVDLTLNVEQIGSNHPYHFEEHILYDTILGKRINKLTLFKDGEPSENISTLLLENILKESPSCESVRLTDENISIGADFVSISFPYLSSEWHSCGFGGIAKGVVVYRALRKPKDLEPVQKMF